LQYLTSLVAAAIQGGISAFERCELGRVANLLAVESESLDKIIDTVSDLDLHRAAIAPHITSLEIGGKSVCFTGECRCMLNGQPITREFAEETARDHGMIVKNSVTKNLDILIVADPLTQSGKAKTARKFGVRIIHEPVFWRSMGLEVE
jgi:DNA polymerase III subunit epsilon